MAHSPGPWRWDPAAHSRNVLDDANGEPIAVYDELFSREQETANKAVLAAAPRMLELLRDLQWHGESEHWQGINACPMCRGDERDHPGYEGHPGTKGGHDTDCPLGELLDELKKAGV